MWHVCPCMVHCPFLQECTFAPKVGRPPESHRHRTNVPVDERLYRHGEGKWEVLERAKAAQESAQLADCTFAPQVGPSCCGCVCSCCCSGALVQQLPSFLLCLMRFLPTHPCISSAAQPAGAAFAGGIQADSPARGGGAEAAERKAGAAASARGARVEGTRWFRVPTDLSYAVEIPCHCYVTTFPAWVGKSILLNRATPTVCPAGPHQPTHNLQPPAQPTVAAAGG